MSKDSLPSDSVNGEGIADHNTTASSGESPTAERIIAPDEVPTAAPDPFDLESLRLGQNFGASVGVKKVLTVVPVRKPNRHEFVRVRSGEQWRLQTAVFEDRIGRELYLVDRSLWDELAGEIYGVWLFLAINRQGDVFLWPVKLPASDGRSSAWNDSALAAASMAEKRWMRMGANMAAGMYDIYEAADELADPSWPTLSFAELLRLAFANHRIASAGHPVLRALRGET
jgi:hypothetical protein